MKYTYVDLKQMAAWSLERKIQVSQTRIIEWVQNYNGLVSVSFSGGLDSTVLLDLVRRIYPEIPAVFCNTGLEHPENYDFVKQIENVDWVKPNVSFHEVLLKYGYPVISKEVANKIRCARNGDKYSLAQLHGELKDKDGNKSRYNMPKYRYLLDTDFKISDQCCYALKKSPIFKYERQTKRKPFVGTLAAESRLRTQAWLRYGCNAFDKQHPSSQPLSFWTKQDILKYIKISQIPYSSAYGKIEEKNGKLYTTGEDRTGCMFCLFGVHLEKSPNRFERMKLIHPQLYDYCINGGKYNENGRWQPYKGLGLKHILETINVPY